MQEVKPVLDDQFKCLAADCPDTCCALWEIIVDEDSLSHWTSLPGDWADRMRDSVEREDGEFRMRQTDGHCILLDETGLCQMYAAFGMDCLCRNCREHPRFSEVYGNRKEVMPGLSCPAWARLWLTQKETASFIEKDTEEPPELNDFDPGWYCRIKKEKETALLLLQDRGMTIEERIRSLLSLAEKIENLQENSDSGKDSWPVYRKKLKNLEILMPEWNTLLNRPDQRPAQKCPDEFAEQFLVYYIYRYWMYAVRTRRLLPWVKFCIFSWICVSRLISNGKNTEECCEVARLYSKEIEHCQENLWSLYRVFCHHSGNYSCSALRKTLEGKS